MGQSVGIDSVIFIYYLEENPIYVDRVEKIFLDIKAGNLEATLATVGLIEILTGPKKAKQFDLALKYKKLLTTFPHLRIVNINDNIIEIASDLRAKYGVNTPDAIHLATAIDFGASKFITNDRRLTKIKEIKVVTLK